MSIEQLDAAAAVAAEQQETAHEEMRDYLAAMFAGKPARELCEACFRAAGEEIGVDLDEEELDTILDHSDVKGHLHDLMSPDLEAFYQEEDGR